MREGENWVYDIFMIFVRIWWSILKAVVFVVTYLIRERPRHLKGPQIGALPAPPKTKKKRQQKRSRKPARARLPVDAALYGLLLFLLGTGLILVSIVLLPPAHQATASGTSMIAVFLTVFAGLGVGAWGMLVVFRAARQPATLLVSPETNLDDTQEIRAVEPVDLAPEGPFVVVYAIRLPHQSSWSGETALHFANQLVFSFPQLLLSITASHDEITWEVIDSAYGLEPGVLEQLIRTSYPEAEVEVNLREPPVVDSPFYRYVCYYHQVNLFVAPVAYVGDFKSFDPLNALTQAMSELQVGERVTYLLAMAGSAQDAYKHGERLITQSTIHPLQFLNRSGFGDAAGKILSGRDRTDKYEYRDQKVLEDKLRAKLYYAYLWIQVDAPEPERVGQIMALVDAQVEHFTRMPYNALMWVERPLDRFTRRVETAEEARESGVIALYERVTAHKRGKGSDEPPFLILEPREIAALWHLPTENFSAPRIGWASGLIDVPEAVARPEDGLVIGVGKAQGREVAVRIPHADRVTHLNVVGRTGTGKSTLLHTLIHQDIANGAGVAVIDPHGKLVRDLLRTSIPPSREADVVVLDIANEDYPPPLNPLNSVTGYTSTLKMVGVIERLFAGTEGAARMASYLRAALIPLGNETQATMRDVTRMFMDDVYREARLEATDDPETLDFWDYHYNSSSLALQRQIAEPIINRIRPFYANPYLYPILCHPDTLDFQLLIRQKKIILISLALDEERVPEQERNLIGALLMSQLQMSGMKAQPDEPYFVYVDEVQRFVTSSLSEMLSEARKYGLALTTANQYLGQLTGKTLEAVMGNVGTTVVFRCSPEDARDLAAYTKPQFDAQALLELDRFQAVVKTQVRGQTQPAFNLLTLPPFDVPEDADVRERRIRQLSRETYTPKHREDVLAWLKERYPRRRPATTSSEAAGDEASFYE